VKVAMARQIKTALPHVNAIGRRHRTTALTWLQAEPK
jgi:hypothetical protein